MSECLEAFDNIIESFFDKETEDIQIVRKALIAFEILKKDTFLINDELGERIIIPIYDIYTSKEEFDFLKEVLK